MDKSVDFRRRASIRDEYEMSTANAGIGKKTADLEIAVSMYRDFAVRLAGHGAMASRRAGIE
jgi:hypothetical protein